LKSGTGTTHRNHSGIRLESELDHAFVIKETNITSWRRTVCGDLTSAFDFTNPDQNTCARHP